MSAICQGVAPRIIGSYGTSKELTNWWGMFRNDVCRGFPFRAGMSVAEVRRLVDENQERIATIRSKQDDDAADGSIDRDKFIVNLHEVYDNQFLYLGVDDSDLRNGTGRLSFSVNGIQQFYVDMAVENGVVRNIYLVPGNWNAIMPLVVLFDGSDDPVGMAASMCRALKGQANPE